MARSIIEWQKKYEANDEKYEAKAIANFEHEYWSIFEELADAGVPLFAFKDESAEMRTSPLLVLTEKEWDSRFTMATHRDLENLYPDFIADESWANPTLSKKQLDDHWNSVKRAYLKAQVIVKKNAQSYALYILDLLHKEETKSGDIPPDFSDVIIESNSSRRNF